MIRIDYHIKTLCPNQSMGLDLSQITTILDRHIRRGERRPKKYDCGSGRTIVISTSKARKISASDKTNLALPISEKR